MTAIEPYLGAKGHLVALREGDLTYLHAHPTGTAESGTTAPHDGAETESRGHGPRGKAADGEIRFAATFPTPGRYRLFLQFQTGDEVRTVAYTLEVPR